MTKTVKTRLFNLSSETADVMYNGSMKSWGVWTIPNFVNYDESIEDIYFRISHAEVPNSFYIINGKNNRLSITDGTIVSHYDVPYGNYNVKSFLFTMKQLLPLSFSIAYSTIMNKFTITNSTHFEVLSSSSISKIMGLSSTANMSSSVIAPFVLQLPYVVSFLPTARLNFRSSSLQLENYHSNDNSNDVFLSLQNSSVHESMILYHNVSGLQHYVTIQNLNKLDIRITDDSNDCIDFNNVDWYVTIRIDVYHATNDEKKNNFTNIIKTNNTKLLADTIDPLDRN